jgi:hypothetical protein
LGKMFPKEYGGEYGGEGPGLDEIGTQPELD